ncbi:hypothetical protein K0T70_001926, partial [Staphylococcus pseudintermedius]|nr:hypothetical protein [Staphylococcus pseudintermedius]
MNKTKEFIKNSWPLLVNTLIGIIIVVLISCFNFSVSKAIFKINSLSDAIAIDFAIFIPLFSFVIIILIGIICDIFVNTINIEVGAENLKDLEVKLSPPSLEGLPTAIMVSIKAKKQEKKDKLIEIKCPFWLSFQSPQNQRIIIENNDAYFINLKYLSFSKEKDCYTATIKCYVINNNVGDQNTNSFQFEKNSNDNFIKKLYFLNYKS